MSLPYHRSTEYASREEWLQARTAGIGGSDAAAVFQISPWVSQFSLWLEKTGVRMRKDTRTGKHLWLGKLMESVIGQAFETETGVECASPGEFRIFFGDEPFQFATLDLTSERVPVIEAKTVGASQVSAWKNGPPLHYQVQVQHQMACTGTTHGAIAVLFGGMQFDFRSFLIERDDRFIDALLRKEREFWWRVETGNAPEADETEATFNALQRVEIDLEKAIELGEEFAAIDQRLQKIKRLTKRLEQLEAKLQNQIKSRMLSAELALLNGRPAYTWKGDSRGTRKLLRVLKSESWEMN